MFDALVNCTRQFTALLVTDLVIDARLLAHAELGVDAAVGAVDSVLLFSIAWYSRAIFVLLITCTCQIEGHFVLLLVFRVSIQMKTYSRIMNGALCRSS